MKTWDKERRRELKLAAVCALWIVPIAVMWLLDSTAIFVHHTCTRFAAHVMDKLEAMDKADEVGN